ncbi:alpha/beta fold hydrolase [Hyunsoonleella jejuensis]|nr:alpha/beta fold hydrolase [Hyunsoonleella jejuensis]
MMPYEYFSRWEVYNGNKNTLVLMLPGYTETQFVFYEFRKCLKESDVSFKTIKYRPFLGDLDLEIEKLMVEIHSVISNNPEKEIVLIGHSMGGLIARCVLERLRDSNKVKSIMISTPHLGTKLASFALGSCGKQMRPKSCFINSMAKAFNKNSLNIYSNADSLVCPRSSLLYLGNNVQTKKKLLHNSILFDREVVQEINKFIDHGNN